MKKSLLSLILVAVPVLARGQATPTATPLASYSPFSLPAINGTFQYGLSAGEVVQTGYGNGSDVFAQTSFSGDMVYTSKSEVKPFSLIYAGGVQVPNQSGASTTVFQSLAASQAYVTRSWVFGVSDVVSYLPQSPTVGLSGIPGTGDVGLNPVQNGLTPSQEILTIENRRISNSVSGNVERSLGAFTSVSAGASYGILRFFGDSGLDSSQISADVAVSRRINARSSASLSATYGTFQYSGLGNGASFITKGLSAGYSRQITRALSGSVSGGPEWIGSSGPLGIPSRLTFTAGAGLNYSVRVYNASLSYTRAVNGGAGVQPGGISDSIIASLRRPFGPSWSASANIGYARTQGLSDFATPVNLSALGITTTGNYNSLFAGGQVTRRLTRTLSAYGSYTAIDQSYSQTNISPTALNGIVQSFAVGISYYPRSLHLGQL